MTARQVNDQQCATRPLALSDGGYFANDSWHDKPSAEALFSLVSRDLDTVSARSYSPTDAISQFTMAYRGPRKSVDAYTACATVPRLIEFLRVLEAVTKVLSFQPG